jgi:hypothetical protein
MPVTTGSQGALFHFRINQVEAIDGTADAGGEIAAAVKDEPLALRRDRNENMRRGYSTYRRLPVQD